MRASELNINTVRCGAYYIEGEDAYWQKAAVDFFINLIPEDFRAFNLKIIDSVSGVNDIKEAVYCLPFTGGDTVIIVKDGQFKEKEGDRAELQAVIKELAGVYLVFSSGENLSAPTKKLMTFIDASRSDVFELRRIIFNSFGEKGIDGAAAELLIEYANRDMARISNEIEKLKAYAGKRTVKADDVKELVANTTENEIYEFTNALAAQNRLAAMRILERFAARGISYSYLLAALTGQYRRMLHAALSDRSDAELAALLGIKEYAVKKSREAASRYTKVRLKNCLDALTEAELSFKSGEMPEDTAFKKAVLKLVTAW